MTPLSVNCGCCGAAPLETEAPEEAACILDGVRGGEAVMLPALLIGDGVVTLIPPPRGPPILMDLQASPGG